ncbi:flagellar filament capping protein FliD [Paenibacillus filicis]|uniref:Flagellar hook-associated protein 2 n=1 Tax=Paenibacillus gyeongsangnamensis TaxID=3388067 RepID=A0ABT4QDV9_9BACL|nr:flagellar filament capping protein FliD [Paenibacillus filicis]MCZ8514885.1 flagellar filament capping protein FliD [Paenibacillus filicis]
MTIRINGLGSSGLDIDSLVSQMMQAKRIPIDQMTQKMTYLSWQRDAYRSMNTDVSAFMNEAQKLTLQSTFMAQKASMSATDAAKVQVTPTTNAFTGNFSLAVTQIAKSASITSSGALGLSSNPTQALNAAGTLTITGSVGTATNVNILATDNISQVVSKINAVTSTTGVKAVYDQLSDKLTIVNAATGSAGNALKITDTTGNTLLGKLNISDTTTPNPSSTAAVTNGQDAIVNLNGTGNVTVSSNSFTLNNINFTLLADPATSGGPYTVSGTNTLDVDSIVSTIKGVFDKYNTFIANTNSKLTEPKYRDYPPLTDAQKANMKDSDITLWNAKAQSGLLAGDDILSSGLDSMRLNLSNPVSGIAAGQISSLADIGITTAPSNGSSSYLAYQENGKIYIDETKLRAALTNAPDQVVALFTKDGARNANGNLTTWTDAGIGTRLYENAKNMVNGLTQKTQTVPYKSYLNQQIDDYANNISQLNSTLNDYEQQLYSQFASLQTSLNQMNSQSSYLSGLFQSK